MDIFSAPFCFSGVRSTFGHCGDMMMMMMIDILENCANHTVLRKDLLKALLVVKTELSLLCGLAMGPKPKQAPVESTVLSDYTR